MEKKPHSKKFQRNKEDFVCEHCGFMVFGDGYRNHCPKCLYSKHVDVQPGDRAMDCRGLMPVSDIIMDHGKLVFIHTCSVCGQEKKNRAHVEDNSDTITALMKEFAAKK